MSDDDDIPVVRCPNLWKSNDVTLDKLDDLYIIDAEHGKIYSKHQNMRDIGWVNNKGYLLININRKKYLKHRIIWYYFHKKWPDGIVDHIDGDIYNNSIHNLRLVDKRENANNKEMHRLGKHPGIRHLPSGNWCAVIRCSNKKWYLGTFRSSEEAYEVYNKISHSDSMFDDIKALRESIVRGWEKR